LNRDVSWFSRAPHQEGVTMSRTWLGLGLIGAALLFAACSSSKDSLLSTGGKGGSARGGAGGTGQQAGSGGTGGARACETAQCLRPYRCITACGGPVISNNCCACEPPAFDDFMGQACGGVGGAAGRGGSGGSGGSAGSGGSGGRGGSGGSAGAGGSGGNAGRGGSAGGAAGSVGSGGTGGTGGRGGTSGAAGTSSGGTGGVVDGGTDARACEMWQCARPYYCITACGAPPVSNNCCACEAPAFDDFMGAVCGDGGAGAVSYLGCRIIGGLDRFVIAKRDTSRNLCVNVAFVAPATAPAGLSLPPNYGVERVTVGTASQCPTNAVIGTPAGPVTGTVELMTSGSTASANADVIVQTPGVDEAIIVRNLNVTGGCL
jgi:hypothetical protein